MQLPSLRSLRTLMDKMKNLTSTLTICTASNGDLSFIVETDYAMVVSKYYNLELEKGNENSQPNGANDKLVEITCMVDSKQLAMCFGSIQVRMGVMNRITSDDKNEISEFSMFFHFSSAKFRWWAMCTKMICSTLALRYGTMSQWNVISLLWANERECEREKIVYISNAVE